MHTNHNWGRGADEEGRWKPDSTLGKTGQRNVIDDGRRERQVSSGRGEVRGREDRGRTRCE